MFTMETDLPVWYQECLACLREELEEPQSFTMFESHGDCNALLQKITALLKSVLDRALSRVEGRESVPERSQVKDAVSAPLMYPTVAVNSLRVKLEEREREVGGGNKASLGETSVSVVQDSPSFVEYSLTELGLTDVSSAFVQLHGEQSSSMLIQEPCGELSEDISTQTQGTMHKRKKVIPAEKCLSYVHNEALESHCPMCGKTCYGGHIKRHLENHVRKASQTQSKPKIPCDICGKVIQRKRMKQHKAQVHGRKVSCSKCGQNVAERCIAWHMKRHEKHPENRCQECGRNFTDLLTLKVHFQKLHMPQEDWIVCEQCGKSMPPISLKAHTERYHTPAASCPICHKVLRSTASLKAHMSLNHRENAKKHQCTMCGKVCPTLQRLRGHEAEHRGEPGPFKCCYCDKRYYTPGGLRQHKRTHTNDRRYQCSMCWKSFLHGKSLAEHMNSHTGERPFICQICGDSFAYSAAFFTHKKLKHGEDKITVEKS